MSDKIVSFMDLHAWKKGHQLVLLVYALTAKFPQKETFALTSQIRRAAVSITSNIAEGFTRRSYKEKVQFYFTALGSLSESQNQILIAKDVGYIKEEEYTKFMMDSTEVQKIINGLIRGCRFVLKT